MLWNPISGWPKHWRYLVYGVLATLIALPVLAFLFAWSGLYSVAATRGHWSITWAVLDFGLASSVRTQSLGIRPPELDDADMVRLGAGHFARACATCHGAPGRPVGPIPSNMLPAPPDLAEAVGEWSSAELFWIVRHGLKYTGMPAWVSERRDDEVWNVVAFLRKLPGLSEAEYRALIRSARIEGGSGIANPEVPRLDGCLTCHDGRDLPTTGRLVPKLAGQSEQYLASSLRAYRTAARQSGIMQPVAADLDEPEIAALAEYYAGLERAPRDAGPPTGDPDLVRLGAEIYNRGLPSESVPACSACHGRNPNFPVLEGQHARYLASQLRLFRSGNRGSTATIDLMSAIARRLDDRQIDAVAAYLETRSLDGSAAPEASGTLGGAGG